MCCFVDQIGEEEDMDENENKDRDEDENEGKYVEESDPEKELSFSSDFD